MRIMIKLFILRALPRDPKGAKSDAAECHPEQDAMDLLLVVNGNIYHRSYSCYMHDRDGHDTL
jgi:hypothetical protein